MNFSLVHNGRKKARVSKTEIFQFRLENFVLGNPKKSIGDKIFTLGGVVSDHTSILPRDFFRFITFYYVKVFKKWPQS